MELRENTYVHVIFFLECSDFNWMATVYRHGEDTWEAEYRFRYFRDNKVEGSDDVKSFQYLKAPPEVDHQEARDALCKALRSVGSTMGQMLQVPFEELTVEGGQEKTLEVLRAQKWANIREVSAEEAKARGLVKEGE